MKKFFTQILTLIAFITIMVGMVIVGSDTEMGFNTVVLAMIPSIVLLPALATVFVFAKTETLNIAGYVLSTMTAVYGLLTFFTDSTYDIISFGMMLMAVPAIIYAFIKLFALLGFVRAKDVKSNANDVATMLNQYKALEKEAILSAEEFEDLKSKVLKNTNTEATSVDDLKKWKKLYDQQVITEEEFTNLKAKTFNK